MVRATRTVSPESPIALVQRNRLCAMAAITVQALFALNWPEGKCAKAWSFRSRIVQLHDSVLAVLGLHDLEGVDAVGDEREISPVWPQFCLRADEPGAAHDQPSSVTGCLGDLRFTVLGVVLQGPPRLLGDRFDRLGDPELHAHTDRIGPSGALEPCDQLAVPEPRVGSQKLLAASARSRHARDQLLGEAHNTALRVCLSLAQPDVQDLACPGSGASSGWYPRCLV